MKVRLPREIHERLIVALQKAGSREVGGVLMGEHIGEADFRIVDLTIQQWQGTIASFVRLVSDTVSLLRRFFKRTENNYMRFNYLGEWHSHPLFPPNPSRKDVRSMLEIVTDEEFGANFAVLLIVRLDGAQGLEATATVFLPDRTYFPCELLKEGPF